MTTDEVVRRYHPAKNKDEAMLPGVPLRDLTREDWRSYPKWMQESIDNTGFWSQPEQPKTIVKQQAAEPAKEA